jgi:hypothetical protein
MTNAHRKKNSTAMEQFDPEAQKTFKSRPQDRPVGLLDLSAANETGKESTTKWQIILTRS